MHIANKTLEGSQPYVLRIEKDHFSSKSSAWCYLVGGTCVACKGLVQGRANGRGGIRIARLPDGLYPARPLWFAALARNPHVTDVSGPGSNRYSLATLLVTPDGWITKAAGRSPEDIIDLSAIRFCTDKGISLMDEVTVHTVDAGNGRLVSLQGALRHKHWNLGDHLKPLLTLPESCRLPQPLIFIVPGTSVESYHVVSLRKLDIAGCGAEVHWCDSIWIRDRINLTGVMYEADTSALACTLMGQTEYERDVKAQVLIGDFTRCLSKKFGSVHEGLKRAFFIGSLNPYKDKDIESSSCVNFTQFLSGCKIIGYTSNVTKLWALLDEDQSGSVDYDELLEGARRWNKNNVPLPPLPQALSTSEPLTKPAPLPPIDSATSGI